MKQYKAVVYHYDSNAPHTKICNTLKECYEFESSFIDEDTYGDDINLEIHTIYTGKLSKQEQIELSWIQYRGWY